MMHNLRKVGEYGGLLSSGLKNQKMQAAMLASAIITGGVYHQYHKPEMTPTGIAQSIDIGDESDFAHYYSTKNISQDQIVSAMNALDGAYDFLSKSEVFNQSYQDKEDLYQLLPLMIKESLLKQDAKSQSGAYGLFQMKGDAITDSREFISEKLSLNAESIDAKSPRDNAILGIVYFSYINPKLLNNKLSLSSEEKMLDREFYYASYNGGAYRIAGMLRSYQDEKNLSEDTYPTWEEFSGWAARKIDQNSSPISSPSSTYAVEYKNWFSQSFHGNKTLISFQGGVDTKVEKIQEMIDYAEVIDAIAQTNQGEKSIQDGDEEVISYHQARLAYNPSFDTFHGSGIIDRNVYRVKQIIGITNNYEQVTPIKGKGILAMLETAGGDTTPEGVEEFLDLNDLDASDAIKLGVRYALPKITEKVEKISAKDIQDSGDTIISEESGEEIFSQKTKPDFYKWLESIPVKTDVLNGKLIILDPGHGGLDPGSSPVAVDSNGDAIAYTQSDLTPARRSGEWNSAQNGEGDDHLHVVEANLSMDVCLRIAKLVREQGGEVKITHYFRDKIDSTNWTGSKNTQAPGLRDDMERWDSWGDGSGRFQQLSTTGLKKRANIRNKWESERNKDDVIFLSIHADSHPGNQESFPLNVLTMQNKASMNQFASEFAQNIGTIREVAATAKPTNRTIHVLSPRAGAERQNVLIELGNMGNANTAYAFRSAVNREKYAIGVFQGIMQTMK